MVVTRSRPSRRALAVALAVLAPLGAASAAFAAAAAAVETRISVSPRTFVSAPGDSPVDFPGVTRASAGQPLPRGYVAVARSVRIMRGSEVASAALRMTCPRGKRWRSGVSSGEIGLSVLDRSVSGRRNVLVMATIDTREIAVGETASGAIHMLCA